MKTRWSASCMASDTWTPHGWTLQASPWRPHSGGSTQDEQTSCNMSRASEEPQRGFKIHLKIVKTCVCWVGLFFFFLFLGGDAQEAAGRPGVLQQIRRVPAIQSQTQLHLLLPAALAGLQEEVGQSHAHKQTRLRGEQIKLIPANLTTVSRRTLDDLCLSFSHPQWGRGKQREGQPAAETVHVSLRLAERPVRDARQRLTKTANKLSCLMFDDFVIKWFF